MRLIDADALIEALHKAGTVMGQPRFLCRTVYECINTAPTIDAVPREDYEALERHFVDWVPVVLCKDCRYYQDNNGGYPNADCKWCKDETPDANDYCSCGEREEDE